VLVKSCLPQLYHLIIWKWSNYYASLSAMHSPLQTKNFPKSTSVIKVALWNDFCLRKGILLCKSTLFIVSKGEWNTKEETGKSRIARTAICQWQFSSWYSEKIKPAVIKFVMLVWKHQSVSQLLSWYKVLRVPDKF